MKTGELAAATGVDRETIRFYETAGLLPPPSRLSNGYRIYGQQHLERLSFIRHCRSLDISLEDIGKLLTTLDVPSPDFSDIDSLIDAHLVRVRARLASMHALEQQLIRLRSRCDSNHADHACGIMAELVAAAHGEACACHVHSQG
ncbi:Cd(II)/Pb(II)-responsive transcriptional regulator [Burkholderiaceae bacterium DAT-1]|nr:Cd(II)/Pb(II)-responsive transcriptional regulator [Burkholderiaceae bacterium DAT-1]